MRPLYRHGHAFVLTLVLALSLVPTQAGAQEGPAGVRVDPVIEEVMRQTTPVLGRVIARDSVIATQVEGVVQTVFADIGMRVGRGDPIIQIDTARLESAVARFEASRAEAQASVSIAQEALDRLQGLSGSAAFNQARFDEARQQVRAARARLTRAEADLAEAQLDLDDATITAPFGGVISNRAAHVGEYLRVGDPVVTLVNDGDLEVEASIPSERFEGLADGMLVAVELDDGTVHEAVMRAAIPVEDPLTRTRVTRFTPVFGDTSKPIAGNQTATVLIPVGEEREIVSVHKDAVINGPQGAIVYVAATDGTAQIRPVTLGLAVGNRFEVLSGLEPGTLVVVRGNERLRPGQPISFPDRSAPDAVPAGDGPPQADAGVPPTSG